MGRTKNVRFRTVHFQSSPEHAQASHHGHHLLPADLAARRRLVDEARRQLTPTPPDAAPKIEVVCHSCGSSDVGRDATAKWDTANQTWDLGTVYDQGFCEDCNGDAVLVERPAEDG